MSSTVRSIVGCLGLCLAYPALAWDCGRAGPGAVDGDTYQVGAEQADHAADFRFEIVVTSGVEGPNHVQLHYGDGQPAWVRVFRGGSRIYLRERCDIPDCGEAMVVCGPGLPRVADLRMMDPPDRISFDWDRTTSVLDGTAGCERREPAPTADYIATFCYSTQVDTIAAGRAEGAFSGRLVSPICEDRPFRLPTDSVVRFEIEDA